MSREKKRLLSPKNFPQGRHVRLVHPLQTAPTPPPPRCPCPPLPLQTKVTPSPKIPSKKHFFRTFAAKRISLIFLGEPAVCECGPSGAELTRPHECPKMARWSNFCNFWGEDILFLVSRSRPDILRDTESRVGERMLPPASPPSTVEKTKKSLPVLLEDPVSCPAR